MSSNKKVPMRKCVGCQEMKSKKEMIRVIRTAENEFVLDATGKKNGRGAYLCPDRECLKQAIPEAVYESLEKEMVGIETG